MPVTVDSPSVQSYLGILQSVISRMAANSAACKTWCIGLTSGILVIIADKGRPQLASAALLPLCLFLFLDAYYLALERRFRNLFNQFIKNLHDGTASGDDLFVLDPDFGCRTTVADTLKSMTSMAVWPFYALLLLMLIIVRFIVL